MEKVYLKTKLAELRPIIWKEIQRHLTGKNPSLYHSMIRDYPKRQGKYFRPSLFLISLELFQANWENHITLAATLQLCEDWLLIHDDVEDGSSERRGRPSLNKLYGNSLAINTGDALHIIMWEVLYDYLNQNQTTNQKSVYFEMVYILKTTLKGQFEDLWWAKDKKLDFSYASYYKMTHNKTCLYTTVGPVKLAGVISGIPEQIFKNIGGWAVPLGLSFQISDDLLDIEQDIWEGKRTLMLLHLLKNCRAEEKSKLIQIYKKPSAYRNENEVSYTFELMNIYKSLEYAQEKAKKFSQISQEKFSLFAKQFPDSQAKNQIQQAIEFAITRDH